MNLVIVESPTKARTLTRFLGREYQVMASMGHVRDLPKKTLGVDVEHNFKPEYVIDEAKKKTITQLRSEAKKALKIILATDPDREGEAIAYHLVQVISENPKSNPSTGSGLPRAESRGKIQNPKLLRIVFHEITRSAVEEALKHPRGIDLALFDAQQARRILDRLVGYKLSPLLWKKVRRGLSAGRVQSVAVRLVAEREREIEKFVKENYWRINSIFDIRYSILGNQKKQTGDKIEAELVGIDGVKVETRETLKLFDGDYTVVKTILTDRLEIERLADEIKKYDYFVSAVEKKEIKRFPPPPLTTSTLQQTAGRLFGFTAKRTMRTAQRLYEQGLITYHRTDSLNLAEKFLQQASEFIKKKYGQKYGLAQPRRFKTRSKVAQEAHEAIRPAELGSGMFDVGSGKELNRDEKRIYELVWKRAVASQMAGAVFDKTVIEIENKTDRSNRTDKTYKFQTSGSVIKFDGFLKVFGYSQEDKILPKAAVGEKLAAVEVNTSEHQTTPPPRYSEASLIKTLEKAGIGRPSTYAPIISTIQARQYVEKNEGRFEPTNLGIAVNDFLVANFADIVEIPFTAGMEDDLDKIANGKVEWVPMMKKFYQPFEKKLEDVAKKAQRVEVAVEETNEQCPKCEGKLVVRIGRFGKFLACGNFPKCKFTKNLLQKTGLKCPKCKAEVVIKKTKRGKRFYGCSNYPKCKFAAWKKEEIKNRT